MSDDRSVFFTYLLQWALVSPLFLVYTVGVLVAALNVSKYRVSSILALIALVFLGVEALIAPVGSIYLVTYCQQRAMPIRQIGYFMSGFHEVMILLQTVGIALLLMAVFYRRQPTAMPPLPDSTSLLQ